MPTKISGLAGGATFTWDAFNPQGNLASDHYVRVWAASDQLSVTIGGITVNGGSDTTNAYYSLNSDGSGFTNANSGKMSVTMPNLPAAIAGVAKGTQKYNLQITDTMEATNNTNSTNNDDSTGGSSTLTAATKTDGDTFDIYMNGTKLKDTNSDGYLEASVPVGQTATFTVYKNGVLSTDAYAWGDGVVHISGDWVEPLDESDEHYIVSGDKSYYYNSSEAIQGSRVGEEDIPVYDNVFVPGDYDNPIAKLAIDVTD